MSTETSRDLVRNIVGERNPDILDCLANLSNDEVFTPPALANQMLDTLPAAVWSNAGLRFLDPGCKSGVFLREAAKRLMVGLADAIPNESDRRQHIFQNMLYGLAITELTANISRRSLYYTKDPTQSGLSVVEMTTPTGNIHFARVEHAYRNGSCLDCGASEATSNRGDSLETHAYSFIHNNAMPKEWKDMRFDVIIGNPPYQMEDGGHGASASPLYHRFVQKAKELNPRYISMIIPARWYAGGKGLDDFRADMLADRRISNLVDFPRLFECFPGVEIKGGVCYFLWDSRHEGDCEVKTVVEGEQQSALTRALNEWDVLVRSNESVSILRKVQSRGDATLDTQVSARKPFGFATNFFGAKNKPAAEAVLLYQNGGTGWISRSQVQKNTEWIDSWKVLIPRAGDGHGRVPMKVMGEPFVASQGSACTETYLVAGTFTAKAEAEFFSAYLKSKFVRLLVSLRKNTQDTNQERFRFVPALDMSRAWTDADLYERYGLDESEIAFIEATIKEMS